MSVQSVYCSSLNLFVLLLCLDYAALCQFLRGKHRLATVELNELPVEVLMAALSTESSTLEELEWSNDIFVRTFIHCTMRNTFDVCVMGSWTCTP